MYLELYYNSNFEPLNIPENEEFNINEILFLLDRLKTEKRIEFEIIDTAKFSEEEWQNKLKSMALYNETLKIKKQKTEKGYLSITVDMEKLLNPKSYFNKAVPIQFGKEIPLLVVYKAKNDLLLNTYPDKQGAKIITIREFLETLKQC